MSPLILRLVDLAIAVVSIVVLAEDVGVIGREVLDFLEPLVAAVVVIIKLRLLAVGQVDVIQAGGLRHLGVVEGAEVVGDAGDAAGVVEDGADFVSGAVDGALLDPPKLVVLVGNGVVRLGAVDVARAPSP